ncbi:MAG: hypothetical protein ACRCW2_13685 [Cellulosilyticaceae bacterium]
MNFFDPLVENLTVSVDEPFVIVLQEQPFLYLAWEPEIPESIELTDKKRHFENLVDVLTLTFEGHQPGEYTILFTYRKQCCDHRIISTRTYNITVLNGEDQ